MSNITAKQHHHRGPRDNHYHSVEHRVVSEMYLRRTLNIKRIKTQTFLLRIKFPKSGDFENKNYVGRSPDPFPSRPNIKEEKIAWLS